jgi:hypothetical protein
VQPAAAGAGAVGGAPAVPSMAPSQRTHLAATGPLSLLPKRLQHSTQTGLPEKARMSFSKVRGARSSMRAPVARS